MGFFNKVQNLPFPLIKLRQDCVSSYYVCFYVFHVILSNFTYPMGVKPHSVFSPWGKNPAATRSLKTGLLYFKQLFLHLMNINIPHGDFLPQDFFSMGNFSHGYPIS